MELQEISRQNKEEWAQLADGLPLYKAKGIFDLGGNYFLEFAPADNAEGMVRHMLSIPQIDSAEMVDLLGNRVAGKLCFVNLNRPMPFGDKDGVNVLVFYCEDSVNVLDFFHSEIKRLEKREQDRYVKAFIDKLDLKITKRLKKMEEKILDEIDTVDRMVRRLYR